MTKPVVKSRKRVAVTVATTTEEATQEVPQAISPSRQAKQHLSKPPAASVRATQVRDALAKLGALVRACHALGVYDKLRSPLSVIEQEIKR